MYFVLLIIILFLLFLWKTKETYENISPNYSKVDNYNEFKYDSPSTVLEEQSWKPVGSGPRREKENSIDVQEPTNNLSLEDIKSYFFSLKKENVGSNTNKSGPTHCIGVWDKEWSQCSEQCGGGIQKKFYRVLQKAGPDGIPCSYEDGDSIDQKCNLLECPINCEGSWSQWSECDQNCYSGTGNYGTTKRTYSIKTEAKDGYINNQFTKATRCDHEDGDIDKETCNTEPCAVDCEGNYKGFGACSNWCDGGVQQNTFQITKYPKSGWFNGVAVKGKECPKNIIQDCNTTAVCPK